VRLQKSEVEDLQDRLASKYTDLFDSIYDAISRVTGKEPTPAIMVRRFKDDYPELVKSLDKKY